MRALVLLVVGAGCTAIADFPEDRLDEVSDALCANDVDDDGDGLTDCQDWGCLDRPVCCTIPSVVIEDAFESVACASNACDAEDRTCAPDEERWTRWGVPYPYLCEGGLAIRKDFASCYPVGVLSRDPVAIAPGLVLEGWFRGIPEPVGHLDLGLTRQASVTDGGNECAPLTPVATMAGLVYAAADDGQVRVIATVEDAPIAEWIGAPGLRKASLEIDEDLAVHFAVDGEEFAIARDVFPADITLEARVVASGLGEVAQLERVRAITGTRCDDPRGWQLAVNATPLDPPAAWDSFERSVPNATLDAEGRVHLRYIGCAAAQNPTCAYQTLALGDAISAPQAPFEHPQTPLFTTDLIVTEGYFVLDVAVDEAGQVAVYGLDDFGLDALAANRLQRIDLAGSSAEIAASVEVALPGSAEGAWDHGSVCCPSVVTVESQRFLYYAGRADVDDGWHIGVAVATGDGAFERRPVPVLDPGDLLGFDSRAVGQPFVLYDAKRALFRMWYAQTGAVDLTSIGYAVSTDGERWHPFPGNPVLTTDDVSLLSIGSPTVVDDGGRLRMWIHGLAPGAVARTIYELENLGAAPP